MAFSCILLRILTSIVLSIFFRLRINYTAYIVSRTTHVIPFQQPGTFGFTPPRPRPSRGGHTDEFGQYPMQDSNSSSSHEHWDEKTAHADPHKPGDDKENEDEKTYNIGCPRNERMSAAPSIRIGMGLTRHVFPARTQITRKMTRG